MIVYIKQLYQTNIIYKIFKLLKIEQIDNKIIINIPLKTNLNKRRTKKIAEKLSKYLYKNNIKNVALEEEIMKNEEFKNILYSNNINILDGKKISKFLVEQLIDKVFKYKNKKIEAGEITILVKENSDINLEHIMKIAQNVKRLNIITYNTKKFKKIVEYLYNELGILIKLSSNQKFNLKYSDIIINMEYLEENLNKLEIPSDAVIINIDNNVDIYSKKFSGVNIKNWEIDIPEKYKMNGFNDKIMYEAYIYQMTTTKIFEQIEKDNITIKKLIGKNGEINKKEF